MVYKRKRKLDNIHQIREALGQIQRSRSEPDFVPHCPLCDGPDFTVVDCSARPHAEWYVVKCAHCGLDDNVQVALCPQMNSGVAPRKPV